MKKTTMYVVVMPDGRYPRTDSRSGPGTTTLDIAKTKVFKSEKGAEKYASRIGATHLKSFTVMVEEESGD